MRSSGYRVVMIVGRFRKQMTFGLGKKPGVPLFGLVGMAIALPPPTITELRIEADTFIMRLTPQFKVIYCENMISTLTDWKSDDISGNDLYTFCHPGDLLMMKKVHVDLVTKGQILSPSIRMLNKRGGYVWVQICATSLYTSKTNDDQTVLAIFQVLSAVEQRECILSLCQQCDTSSAPANIKRSSKDVSSLVDAFDVPPTTEVRSSSADDLSNSTTVDYNNSNEVRSSPHSSEMHRAPDEVPDVLYDKPDGNNLLETIASSTDYNKNENKTSRRKTDRPRKRRRDCDSDDETTSDPFNRSHGSESTGESVLERSFDNSDALNLTAFEKDSLSASLMKDSVKSKDVAESPEDLSVRSACDRNSSADALQNMYKLTESRTLTEPHGTGSHSVRELEKIMTKHFPPGNRDKTNSVNISDTHKQKSTIQWIGSSNALSTDSMTASAFLRQLYTSRESVIRSNHGRPCVYNGDISSLNMLTPPGTELFKDPLQLNIPQITVHNRSPMNISQSPDTIVGSTSDAFSMTPPSSVSPQEKVTSPFHDNTMTDHVMMQYAAHASEELGQSRNAPPPGLQLDNSRLSFLSVPNGYQHENMTDFHQFSHSAGQTGSITNYNTRPASNGIWYGSAYTS